MEKLKLTDICDFQGGSQPPKEQWTNELKDGYIRMLQIRDFTQGKNENEYVKISNTLKTCEDDDILIARYGASVGKVLSGLSGAYNVAIIKSIPDISKVLKKYLYYYFNTDYFQNRIKSVGSRAAQAGFNKTDLKDFEIGIPSLIEQQKIIEILDKSQELIKKRKEQIKALDELVKSKFIEMFGELKNNKNNFDIVALESLTTKITDGVHSKPDYTAEGVEFISVKDINKGKLDFSNCKYISQEAHESYIKRCKPEIGDVLYTKVGATYGIPAVVDIEKEFSLYVSVALLKLKKDIVNPVYIKEALRSVDLKRQADRQVKGIGVPDLHLVEIKKFKIFNPPLELQNQFADFVKEVDKLKFEMEKSLKELEDNFNSLMQKAFKGELFD